MNSELISHNVYHQGYHIIDDFLDLQHYQSLRASVQKMHQNGLFKNARIGQKINTKLNSEIRTDTILWLNEQEKDPAIQAYLQKSQAIAQILNQALYLGLFHFETHFAAYDPGSFYKLHVDQFATNKDRKISCVYYLNNEWHPEFGGELKLYSSEEQLITTVSPHGNRFICFNSELPHEVNVTNQTRYSLTGWMKTRDSI